MAEAVLHPDPSHFPIGTTVTIKEAPAVPVLAGEPPGATVSAPAVATSGTLTVTGVAESTRYLGWAHVAGTDRYVQFATAGPAAAGAGAIPPLEPWKPLAYGASGKDYGAPYQVGRYRKNALSNRVEVDGLLVVSAAAGPVATLPAGFRPAVEAYITLGTTAWTIATNGEVSCNTTGNQSLTGVSFPLE
jgi:hypothetical protein